MKLPQTRSLIGILALILCFGIVVTILLFHQDDKTIVIQVLSSITPFIGMVLGYYFGAAHNSQDSTTSNNKTRKMRQVFWAIESLEDQLDGINGTPVSTPFPVKDMVNQDSAYEIMEDTTGIPVLTVDTNSAITLNLAGYDVISQPAEFIGGKPVRKPR